MSKSLLPSKDRGSYWNAHYRFKRLHQRLSLWSISVEIPKAEVTWFSGDDIHERCRVYQFDHEIRFPHIVFRPYCLLYGHHDDSYGSCVICEKRLHNGLHSVVKNRKDERE